MVDAFYSVFNKLDKSQQQFVEYRFSHEVDRLKQTQKLEMTDKLVSQALYKKETTSNSVIKDTLHYVSSTAIGNYSNRDSYTMSTDLENQVERVGHSKTQIKQETKVTALTPAIQQPKVPVKRIPSVRPQEKTNTRERGREMTR